MHGATKCLLVHPLGASTWMPMPWSHTVPFHCCSFCPFPVTEHLVSTREGATSALYQCLYIPSPHPPPADGALLLTPITQDENHAEKSSVSQVIFVNVCGPLCLQPPWVSLVPSTPTLHPCARQVFPGCSVPVSHDQPGLCVAGAHLCCSTVP